MCKMEGRETNTPNYKGHSLNSTSRRHGRYTTKRPSTKLPGFTTSHPLYSNTTSLPPLLTTNYTQHTLTIITTSGRGNRRREPSNAALRGATCRLIGNKWPCRTTVFTIYTHTHSTLLHTRTGPPSTRCLSCSSPNDPPTRRGTHTPPDSAHGSYASFHQHTHTDTGYSQTPSDHRIP